MYYIEYLIRAKFPSVKDFADACGITRCTVHHYITGFRFPNTHNFMTMANELNMSAEELYKNWFREVRT